MIFLKVLIFLIGLLQANDSRHTATVTLVSVVFFYFRFFTNTTIADCPPYAAVSHRRSSFPARRCSCLERFAAPRHVGTISGCPPQSPQDALLQALLSIMPFRCCACEVTLVIVGHINRFFTYLLTYLLLPIHPLK